MTDATPEGRGVMLTREDVKVLKHLRIHLLGLSEDVVEAEDEERALYRALAHIEALDRAARAVVEEVRTQRYATPDAVRWASELSALLLDGKEPKT